LPCSPRYALLADDNLQHVARLEHEDAADLGPKTAGATADTALCSSGFNQVVAIAGTVNSAAFAWFETPRLPIATAQRTALRNLTLRCMFLSLGLVKRSA
jgi:hypothetical protein